MKYLALLIAFSGCTDTMRGPQGNLGPQGFPGRNGHNALVLTVASNPNCVNGGSFLLSGTDLNDNSVLEVSEVVSSANVCDGATGAMGAQGQAPQYTPVIVIEPCGHASSSYKEVLLGLQGGAIYGSFTQSSDALTVRNTLLPDGGFYDTDDSKCNFVISTDGSGNRSLTYDGSTQTGAVYQSGAALYNVLSQVWSE